MINKQRKPGTVMMTKKNYKQQQHFQRFYTVVLPASNGRKCMLYYRRHNPSLKSQQKEQIRGMNLYNFMNDPKGIMGQNNNENPQKDFPKDRTLQLITFEENINLQIGKKIFRKLGKIRKFANGQGTYKGRNIHYILIVYKFEFDLVKAFREQFLQALINEEVKNMNLKLTQQELQEYRVSMIEGHLGQQAKQKMQQVSALQKDGYNVVTDRFGDFKVDYIANKKFIQNLPQLKNRKKKIQKEKRLKQELRERQRKQQEEARLLNKQSKQVNDRNYGVQSGNQQ